MGCFFIDLTNGNDAYDGTQTWVHAALASCFWATDGTDIGNSATLTDVTAPFAEGDIGKIIHVTSAANEAWMLVTGVNITGEIASGTIWGQPSTLPEEGVEDAATGTGPVKTYSRLTALAADSTPATASSRPGSSGASTARARRTTSTRSPARTTRRSFPRASRSPLGSIRLPC